MTGGFAKWGNLWSVLKTKILFCCSNQNGCVDGACGDMGDGRDSSGIGLETWGKQITGKNLV